MSKSLKLKIRSIGNAVLHGRWGRRAMRAIVFATLLALPSVANDALAGSIPTVTVTQPVDVNVVNQPVAVDLGTQSVDVNVVGQPDQSIPLTQFMAMSKSCKADAPYACQDVYSFGGGGFQLQYVSLSVVTHNQEGCRALVLMVVPGGVGGTGRQENAVLEINTAPQFGTETTTLPFPAPILAASGDSISVYSTVSGPDADEDNYCYVTMSFGGKQL